MNNSKQNKPNLICMYNISGYACLNLKGTKAVCQSHNFWCARHSEAKDKKLTLGKKVQPLQFNIAMSC